MSGGWLVDQQTGSAADFHRRALPEPAVRSIWGFVVDRPAVVLGSTQAAEVVDRDAARRAGVEVVRRRSGGGAVLVAPGDVSWVDVVVPAGDPLWRADVGRSFDPVGQAWATVLRRMGTADPVVHEGPLVRTRWSDLVCFAGLGPGEVTVGGAKVIGMSQRRSRAGARFQCAVLHRWDPEPLVSLLALEPEERSRAIADLTDVARGIGPVTPRDVSAELHAALEGLAA